MKYRYAVLGAGRQGIAAAYDLARFGQAEVIILADLDPDVAQAGAERVNGLIHREAVCSAQVDVADSAKVASLLKGITSCLSAVPYRFNLGICEAAIRAGVSMCDLGGHTGIVWQQLGHDDAARQAGVTVVPDCGMGPGMNVSLATYAMSLVQKPREVYVYDGGLPQDPQPPWHYSLTFNVGGLTNEYDGIAYFLRSGKIVGVPCFEGYEMLEFPPPLGRLEAFVTSGGLSTAPWTFDGTLEVLENKTLRYPGHWAQFSSFSQLGLLGLDPVHVGGVDIIPRDLFHALLEPKITGPEIRDVCMIRVKCVGEENGHPAEAIVELIDYYDERTDFTAMQRLTGWHASIVAIQSAHGRTPRGAIPIERAIAGSTIVGEARRRGLDIRESVTILDRSET